VSALHPLAAVAMAAVAIATVLAGTPAVLAAVQEINSPGPAVRMSTNGAVTGFFVAKCTTLSSQPKRTICYNAPWVFDGQRVSKLTSKFASNANAKAVAVNDALELVGADVNGAWFYSNGRVTYTDGTDPNVRGTRLFALNNNGVAVGMSSVAGVYQPVTYVNNGIPSPVLIPGEVAVDINDAGMIAGWYKAADNTEQSFVDTGGAVVDIPKLDPVNPSNCRPVRISQVNAATGDVWVAGHCSGRPFIYSLNGARLVGLGNLPGFTNLSVQSVNSSGVAVGTGIRPGAAAPDGYTAVVWSNDPTIGYATPTDLNALQPFAPATAWNAHATDINEGGTVLTGYNDTSGNFYTFLLK
jgi:hypothetical protein